jgi:hypothetical protein
MRNALQPASKLTFAGGLALIAAACLVLFLFDPAHYRFYPRCLLYQTTGLLCPGCGSLRALHQLLHGQVLAAIRYNALLVLSAPVAAWLVARCLFRRLNGQTQPLGFHPAWLWAALAALCLFGVLRNLPFAHAVWLAP